MTKGGARIYAKRSSVRALKFLSTCKDPIVHAAVIKRAPDPVLKHFCNAALNAERDVRFSAAQTRELRKDRQANARLTNKKLPYHRKDVHWFKRVGGLQQPFFQLSCREFSVQYVPPYFQRLILTNVTCCKICSGPSTAKAKSTLA